MKAVIPVAGAGIRLRPLTYTQPKPLIPVAGKPILSFIIDQLIGIGIQEFVFVIGYLGEKIRDYVEHAYPEIQKEFVQQEERLGSAHALYIAREYFRDAEELMIFFGDAIIDMDFERVLREPTSCLGVKKVQDPREYGVVEFREDGFVSRVIEKPRIPKSNLAMVGFYRIKEVPILIESLEFNVANNIRSEGEFPLTDALMRMIEKKVEFSTVEVDNWFNCGKKEVLLEANAILLDREGYASSNLPPFDNSIIIHPVSIGSQCEITNSIIGPHVTIGDNVQISYSIVKDSIIGNFASIKEVILQKSVVGNDASITGMRQSLNIGDNTEIDFGSPG
ncbi:MAG: NTP transferase domain-containing protein [Haliscomenobacter sp.]|nr:NTP transferase domain-containing protein [Haliscomenobacter sp.]MBK8655287.1 NTP transferase domain-containing protein [Haliscomenobacter sp.]MBP9075707.1 NTP transferase domain-containing protein [Haliscomenobacter sp.]MBP9873385.1 NTP transferase domain-containing protein [Haliscomenobacter sp.]